MADVIINDVCLWIKNVGSGPERRALLGLEPGARIWLLVDDKPILFERMQDCSDGRSTRGLKPIGPTKAIWSQLYELSRISNVCMFDFEFKERPADAEAGREKFAS